MCSSAFLYLPASCCAFLMYFNCSTLPSFRRCSCRSGTQNQKTSTYPRPPRGVRCTSKPSKLSNTRNQSPPYQRPRHNCHTVASCGQGRSIDQRIPIVSPHCHSQRRGGGLLRRPAEVESCPCKEDHQTTHYTEG